MNKLHGPAPSDGSLGMKTEPGVNQPVWEYERLMSLNQSQFRSVTISLRLLEERLVDIERVIAQDEKGILYERVAHFTPEQLAQMRELIAVMRQGIQHATDEFHLPREEHNVERYIVGTLSLTWESLEEIRSRHLKSYGDVDPALRDTLDPILRLLIQQLFTLIDVTSGKERPQPSHLDEEE
jgi:hypothetical protein